MMIQPENERGRLQREIASLQAKEPTSRVGRFFDWASFRRSRRNARIHALTGEQERQDLYYRTVKLAFETHGLKAYEKSEDREADLEILDHNLRIFPSYLAADFVSSLRTLVRIGEGETSTQEEQRYGRMADRIAGHLNGLVNSGRWSGDYGRFQEPLHQNGWRASSTGYMRI